MAALLAAATIALAETQRMPPRLGLDETEVADAATPDPGTVQPIAVLRAEQESIALGDGIYDWSVILSRMEALRESGWSVVVALIRGTAAPSGEGIESWLDFVRSAVRVTGERATALQLGEVFEPTDEADAAVLAFALKQAAIVARAEASRMGIELTLVTAGVSAARRDLLRDLWERDVTPYVDAVAVDFELEDDAAIESDVQQIVIDSLSHPPAPALWVTVRGPGQESTSVVGAAVRALAAGAAVAIVRGPAAQERAAVVARIGSEIARGYSPAPPGQFTLADPREPTASAGRVLGQFVDATGRQVLVVYEARESAVDTDALLIVGGAATLRNARSIDPRDGSTSRLPAIRAVGLAALSVPRGRGPMLVLWERELPGLGALPIETLPVSGVRAWSAEEIIARHQQVAQVQADRLDRWTARGRTDFRYKLGEAGATIDVSIENNYFWERGRELEWEQTDYFVNGNRLRWKSIPELPLIQPERVLTLPLDLTLDRTYTYRLAGEDRLDGRDSWILEFRPTDPAAPQSLYRGRVWIDKNSFVRLKAAVVQSGLEAPVLSNDEIDLWVEVRGPDGENYWMLTRVEGQQLWSALGRTLVVRREVRLTDVAINPPVVDFAAARDRAYASNNRMIRDTEAGQRYLNRGEDGSRTVAEEADTSQWFAAAGAFRDGASDGVQPLAGVNWLDYDLGGKNIQANLLFAGVVAFGNLTKPDLFGGRAEGTIEGTLLGIKFNDKVFTGDVEALPERIDQRTQRVGLRLGTRLGSFTRLHVVGGLAFRQYFQDADARRARARYDGIPPATLDFVLPEDHWEVGVGAEVEFHRRAWTVRGSFRDLHRSRWEPWGLTDGTTLGRYDPTNEAFVPGELEPARKSFSRWNLTGFKEWYLPKFQKLRAEISRLDGADLDRFSRYSFGMFGEDRLDGFSGSGVRFDEGWVGRGGYSFNILEILRVDATVARARVRDESSSASAQSFTGVGMSVNTVGPWKTLIAASWGHALDADVTELKGKDEFSLLVLKLF